MKAQKDYYESASPWPFGYHCGDNTLIRPGVAELCTKQRALAAKFAISAYHPAARALDELEKRMTRAELAVFTPKELER